jgi:hypothetical protein
MIRWAILGRGRAGKSSAILGLAQALRSRGLSLGGVAQPSLMHEGRVIGYDLVDLRSEERLPFARKRDTILPGQLSFAFDERAWDWACSLILTARSSADVLLVDEIGRLEADEGTGHLPALLSPQPDACACWILGVRQDREAALRAKLGPFARELFAPVDPAMLALLSEEILLLLNARKGADGAN